MKIPKTEASTILRCGLILYPSQDQAIDKVLTSLMEKIPAQYILLADSSGQVISVIGKREQGDPVALGALVASDMAASQEMASITGEYQSYQMILREGSQVNNWIINAGPHLDLMFKVSASVPLGWTRLVIRRAAELIAQIAETPIEEEGDSGESIEIDDADFSDQIDKSLEELWRM